LKYRGLSLKLAGDRVSRHLENNITMIPIVTKVRNKWDRLEKMGTG